MHLSCTWFSLVQFFAIVLPHIIRFVLSTNFKAIVFWLLLNISKSLDMKNRNKIGDRGDLCGILVGVNIGLLLYPLNIILVVRFVKKAWIKLTIQSSKPFFFKIHRSLLYDMLSKAPFKSRFNINTMQFR